MGVDHGGFDVLVTEKFLDGADIVSALEEVGGEGVAEGVGGDSLVHFCDAGGFADFFLEGGFVDVVAAESPIPTFPQGGGRRAFASIPTFSHFKSRSGGRRAHTSFCFGGYSPSGRGGRMRILGKVGGGEDVLPNPLFMGRWVFFIQSIRHVDGAKSVGKVFFVDGVDVFEVLA